MKIVLQNLTKRYPNRNRKIKQDVIAVNDFTFEIPDGKLIGLLGPSGCGKSTTLNMICGLEKPSSGKIFFGEDDVTELPPENRGVGMVFQSYALYPHLTVRQNILFPLENLKGDARPSREEMQKKAEEAARLVQIDMLLDRKPSELSGGQQQRVAIARALVKMPRVLLLDEPLSNLDARLRLQTREEIRRIQRETGITTVFVTHDQEEAMSISDLIVVMETGVVQQIGKPQEVYENPRNLFVAKFLGTPPINVFEGRIRGGKLYMGEDLIYENVKEISEGKNGGASSATDQTVTVGIRPEGFIPDENGPLCCRLNAVEVMGRDTSVVFTHPASPAKENRAIVSSDDIRELQGSTVNFSLKPHKVYLFRENGERILYTAEAPAGKGKGREAVLSGTEKQ
ncbi:MAG: ABC transporter ATP-binding protein [Blautia sp.]|nr:ABC transporter ATP-binding protein [Blautia sp.]